MGVRCIASVVDRRLTAEIQPGYRTSRGQLARFYVCVTSHGLSPGSPQHNCHFVSGLRFDCFIFPADARNQEYTRTGSGVVSWPFVRCTLVLITVFPVNVYIIAVVFIVRLRHDARRGPQLTSDRS